MFLPFIRTQHDTLITQSKSTNNWYLSVTMPTSVATTAVSSTQEVRNCREEKTDSVNEEGLPIESHDDFFWTYTEEPHKTRRLAIIKAHPEVCMPSHPMLIPSLTRCRS